MRRFVGAVVSAVLLIAVPARADSLAEQVNRAIERGVAVVRKYVGEDGTGTTRYHADYPVGDTALLLYTLVKSGVSPDDPQVRKSLEWLRYRKHEKTYSAAVYILALDAFRDRAYAPQIVEAAAWLESQFHAESGRWNYPGNWTDLSNTQYAVLGLWVAERHGFQAKPETWAELVRGVGANQHASGGFSYHYDWGETGGMTVGGLTCLELALRRLPESDRRWRDARRAARASLERGWAYLERNFRVDVNPHGPRGTHRDWIHYYLYGVERLAAIAERDRIAGRDWYAEGARRLVETQHDDGSWGEPWDTCFALLFLRRATFTGTPRPPEGEASARKPDEPQWARDARWIRRWLVAGPVKDPDDALFDAPPFATAKLAPTPGSESGGRRWAAVESPTEFVHLGDPEEPVERSHSWAFTWLHAASDVDVVLRFGADDGVRVVLDGAVVFEDHNHDSLGSDAYRVPVRLAAGAHRLLVQVENWGGATGLWFRVGTADGRAVPGLRASLRADGADDSETARAQPDHFTLPDLLRLLPRDRNLELTFSTPEQLARIALDGNPWDTPRWTLRHETVEDHRPIPGATGLLWMHPEEPERPSNAYWKVRVPESAPRVRVRAASVARESADGVLRVGVFDGEMHWLISELLTGADDADASAWRWFEADLADWAGKEVLVVLQSAAGGDPGWYFESCWIDAVEIRSAP